MIRTYWNQKVLDIGYKWRTLIYKLHLQPGRPPSFSLNERMLAAAVRENVPALEVVFPDRYDYAISKSPLEWLSGARKVVPTKIPGYKRDMVFYWHNVPLNFPREGRKKELFQAVGQERLI